MDKRIQNLLDKTYALESELLQQPATGEGEKKKLNDVRIALQSVKDELVSLDRTQAAFMSSCNSK